jgi:hypothetical protein
VSTCAVPHHESTYPEEKWPAKTGRNARSVLGSAHAVDREGTLHAWIRVATGIKTLEECEGTTLACGVGVSK